MWTNKIVPKGIITCYINNDINERVIILKKLISHLPDTYAFHDLNVYITFFAFKLYIHQSASICGWKILELQIFLQNVNVVNGYG